MLRGGFCHEWSGDGLLLFKGVFTINGPKMSHVWKRQITGNLVHDRITYIALNLLLKFEFAIHVLDSWVGNLSSSMWIALFLNWGTAKAKEEHMDTLQFQTIFIILFIFWMFLNGNIGLNNCYFKSIAMSHVHHFSKKKKS